MILLDARVICNFGNARVVDSGVSPFDGDDLLVQQRRNGQWENVNSFNSLSDDYAYTNAISTAQQAARSAP